MFDEGKGGGDVVGDDSSSKTVVGVVGAVYDLFKAVELEDALDWSKDLVGRIMETIKKNFIEQTSHVTVQKNFTSFKSFF